MILVTEESGMDFNVIGVFYGIAQLQNFAKKEYSIKNLKLKECSPLEDFHGTKLRLSVKIDKYTTWYIYDITIHPSKELALEECRSWKMSEKELERTGW